MSERIVIVEDEPDLAFLIRRNLEVEGYAVEVYTDGIAASEQIHRSPPLLVILDLMLPKRSGMEVLADVRRHHAKLPVIILTARSGVQERVRGLRLGADDYLTKPFEMAELLARVEAVLRRSRPEAGRPDTLVLGDIEVDFTAMRAHRGVEDLHLSTRELKLLRALAGAAGRAVSREDLLIAAWSSDEAVTARTVDAHIKNLRKKIEHDPSNPAYVRTVHREGYMLVVPD